MVNGGRTISFGLKLFGIFTDEKPVIAQITVIRERVIANIAESQIARASSNFEIHSYVEKAAFKLDVNTEVNAATFWSGKNNRILAENYALNMDKMTLEMTPGGKYLDSLKLFKKYPYEQAIRPWEVISGKFAQNASGQVSAFVENSSPSGIFNRIEHPVLLLNPNVTKIIFSPEIEYIKQLKF